MPGPFVGAIPVTSCDATGTALGTSGGNLNVNVSQIQGQAASIWGIPAPLNAVTNAQIVAAGMWAQTGTTGLDNIRTPTIFKRVVATASGSTALWTPTAGKKFRLMRYMISVPSNAVAAAQADLVISLLDAAADIAQDHVVNIPAAAVLTAAPPLYVSPWLDLGNGVLSALANNVLNVNLSFALTGGQVNVIACGTEE